MCHCDIAHTTESNKNKKRNMYRTRICFFHFPRHFFYDYVKMVWSEFINRTPIMGVLKKIAVPCESFYMKSNDLTYGLKELKLVTMS